MTFQQFKDAAKKTGIGFNVFFETAFFSATPIGTKGNSPVFVAEKTKHFTLYYPNNQGGATLVQGFGADRIINFYNNIEDISFCGF